MEFSTMIKKDEIFSSKNTTTEWYPIHEICEKLNVEPWQVYNLLTQKKIEKCKGKDGHSLYTLPVEPKGLPAKLVAKELGLSVKTISAMKKRGQISPCSLKPLRYSQEEVDRLKKHYEENKPLKKTIIPEGYYSPRKFQQMTDYSYSEIYRNYRDGKIAVWKNPENGRLYYKFTKDFDYGEHSVKSAAAFLGVCKLTVYRYLKNGELKAKTTSPRITISEKELRKIKDEKAFIKENFYD